MGRSGDAVQSVRAFARGLAVIRSFGADARRSTLTEVAARTGLTRAGARRFLHTLVELEYAATDGKYFWLTPRILDLGYSYLSSMPLWGIAQEYLERLSEELGQSTSISVLEGRDIVYVTRVPTRRILVSSLSVGSRIPAHVVSMGRIQLAALPDRDLDKYLEEAPLERFTPHTITDRDELRRILLEDRARGYSVVSRELEVGIAGVAVPIKDRQGRTIAGMNVSFQPDGVLDPATLERYVQALQKTRLEIENVLNMRS